MQVRSYAKINWALRVLGRRADDYHDLETLFQTISLHDVLTFAPADQLTLICDDASLPADERNLVYRAAQALGAPPVRIELQKRIPAGGGLGGGSSNAAATLLALDQMFSMALPYEQLHDIALTLGSDVPFFLVGGTAYATGRGEELIPLPPAAPIPLLLVLPKERISTPEAFGLIRRYSRPVGVDRYTEMVGKGLLDHAAELTNDFEEPVFAKYPRLRELKERLAQSGAAWSGMSGSGSTIVGAFRSQSTRDAAIPAFADVQAVAAETISAPRGA